MEEHFVVVVKISRVTRTTTDVVTRGKTFKEEREVDELLSAAVKASTIEEAGRKAKGIIDLETK